MLRDFTIPIKNVAEIAQGNAFLVQADNASVLANNPTGTTQLCDIPVHVEMQLMSINTTFSSQAGTTISNAILLLGFLHPNSFLTTSLKDLVPSALGNMNAGLHVLNL